MASSSEQRDELDFYDSLHLTENWDLCYDSIPGSNLDIELYWNALQKSIAIHKSGSAGHCFTLLDIGAGTGRVLKGLNNRARESELNIPLLRIIAIDISHHMVTRGAQSATLNYLGSTTWKFGSALALPMALDSQDQKIDFLFMAASSLGHLYRPGEGELFFHNIAQVLRPETGRACVSIWKQWFKAADAKDPVMEEDYGDVNEPTCDFESIRFPGIVYRNKYLPHKLVDGVLLCNTDISVLQRHSDGAETVLETHETVLRQKIWKETDLQNVLENVGLEIDSRHYTPIDIVFTLKLIV